MTKPTPLRRGLPRVRGGAPWPGGSDPVGEIPVVERPAAPAAVAVEAVQTIAETAPEPATRVVAALAPGIRRGLPRTSGGQPWPTGAVVVQSVVDEPVEAPAVPVTAAPSSAARTAPAPTPATPTPAIPTSAARTAPAPTPAPARAAATGIRDFSRRQRIGLGVLAGVGAVILASLVVLAARGLYTFGGFRDFVATYPGEYHLPESAPVGIPAWLGWQHAFNAFLIVLIIRSGLQVRSERRPAAYWTPRWNRARKISLTLWFHQSLDILWLANGLLFIVLLFATGQWMRIVPTSWEVFPNALSAGVQYLTLDWPTENGWVNYNSLQQLAYFTTVFVAAPLAVVTGVRMSGIWPTKAARLSRLYPVEWARRVHFPVMLYFVGFIAVHVLLVFATGALRNLNHMYAAQGSTDPDAFADNWAGFGMFALSLLVIGVAIAAARPVVLAPIARLFGSVGR
jgi:thiosulfate reductase cytochrome b subunit